jgi:YcaO-like protein with predicted kinase domain
MLDLIAAAQKAAGISRVANLTGLDRLGFPVWAAMRPLSLSLAVSQGKGETDAQAKISAIMESLEGFHAERPLCASHVRRLRDVHISRQYQNVFDLSIYSTARIDPDLEIEWVGGRELISGNDVYVPSELVDLDFFPPGGGAAIFHKNSVGLAGGASADDANFHALCEVMENDQISFWMAGMPHDRFGTDRRLRLDTVSDARCARLIERIRAANLRLGVWFAGCELAMPTFACIVYDDQPGALFPHRASGNGAHPYKGVALYRALAEAVQSRVTFISGARDDFYADRYDAARADTPAAVRWKEAIEAAPERLDFADIPEYPRAASNAELLRHAFADLAAAGCRRVISVDLTRPEVGIPFVKVIVPGLEIDFETPLYTPGPRMETFLTGGSTS